MNPNLNITIICVIAEETVEPMRIDVLFQEEILQSSVQKHQGYPSRKRWLPRTNPSLHALHNFHFYHS